jgi:outer membrane protein OmpA-like peptidoglycan-associated protein
MLKTASDAIEVGKKGVEFIDKGSNLFIRFLPNNKEHAQGKPPRLIFDQVAFSNDTFELTEVAKLSLDSVVAYLKNPPGKSEKVLVEGHASAVGSAQHNLWLSNERARRVRDYLTDHGIEQDRILYYGFGQGYLWLPFFPEHPDNRRVRITTCGEGWGSDRCLAAR